MEIKDISVEQVIAKDSDYLVLQDPTTGIGYKITKANFLQGLSPATVSIPVNRCTGATAVASSTYNYFYPVDSVINGSRKGNWGNSGGWNSASTVPQWVEIDFNAAYSISKINVFTLQDAYGSPSEPTLDMTFSVYGVTAFDIQYWNGSTWITINSITGNNKVWVQAIFSPITTNKIRIYINATIDGYARLVQVEAY